MDAAAEKVHPRRRQRVEPCVDGETEQPANVVSKVLGDDNLLREIIVRVGFPTTLVHAALACKRWLGHAAYPAFLCRSHKLHPPCLLGYYISERSAAPKQLNVCLRQICPWLICSYLFIIRLYSYAFRFDPSDL
ncbi:uncharacterized protein [Triticum aestivum]|uniref:uncharacterized protein n=1 Tax=Triticum aestivum TaxID=4565 RepID=UPI001D02AF8E|nr:uncharacterized protein LOC123142954 [Triticum aestivum]